MADGVEATSRDSWTGRIEFLLTMVGFTVGLGNVWRFPYLCYLHGGGAFLIPYIICVAVCGLPVFFLEMSWGQYMNAGGFKMYDMCPLMRGTAVASMMITIYGAPVFTVIMAWSFYYLFNSFTTLLPWSHCNNTWNTDQCRATSGGESLLPTSVHHNSSISNMNGYSMPENTSKATHYLNSTYDIKNETVSAILMRPATEFWERQVLQLSDGLENMGGLRWELLALCLLGYAITFFCIWWGITTSGKVMYITATLPYALMIALLIRGITLPGSLEGIKFYISPDLKKLASLQVWVDAGSQVFYSYSLGICSIPVIGSYNKFNYNCWRDVLMIAVMNSGTSFFVGFVVFSTLGFMAHQQGVSVADVAESGPGLVFVAYPSALSEMPYAPLWSVVFFFMILLIGISSQFVNTQCMSAFFIDQFPLTFKTHWRKKLLILTIEAIYFCIGLPLLTNGGIYVVRLYDYYGSGFTLMLAGFFECITIAYIYGVDRFYENIQEMLGYKIGPYMKYCWLITAPGYILLIFLVSMINYENLVHNRTYVYPKWTVAVGWLLTCSSIVCIPLVIGIKLVKSTGSFKERVQSEIQPMQRTSPIKEAGPELEMNRHKNNLF